MCAKFLAQCLALVNTQNNGEHLHFPSLLPNHLWLNLSVSWHNDVCNIPNSKTELVHSHMVYLWALSSCLWCSLRTFLFLLSRFFNSFLILVHQVYIRLLGLLTCLEALHHPGSLRPTSSDFKFTFLCDLGVIEASDRGISISHYCPGTIKTEFLPLLLTPNLHTPQNSPSVWGTGHRVLQYPSLSP